MEVIEANISQEIYRQIWHCVYYYYIRNPRLTQSEIAERLKISRPKVSRYLQLAEEMGLIKISASPPRQIDVEVRLIDLFGLQDARVIPVPEGYALSLTRVLGCAAAEYLEQLLADYYKTNPGRIVSIGLAAGRSVYETVQALKPGLFKGLEIYPLVGGPRAPTVITASENVGIMYAKYAPQGARSYELHFSNNKNTNSNANAMNETFENIRQVDFAIVGIGNISENSTLGKNLLTFGFDLQRLREKDIVGDICSRLLYSDGTPVDFSLHDQLIGISLDDLRNLHQKHGKRVIAVSGGIEKFPAILAALRGGGQGPYVDTLITDETLASQLLNI
jgi:DNA-binding transcriptional regulator LsrR (DeoR family)